MEKEYNLREHDSSSPLQKESFCDDNINLWYDTDQVITDESLFRSNEIRGMERDRKLFNKEWSEAHQ